MRRVNRGAQLTAARDVTNVIHCIVRYQRDLPLVTRLHSAMTMMFSTVRALIMNPSLRWHVYVQMNTHEHNLMSIGESGESAEVSNFLHRKNNRFVKTIQAAIRGLRKGGVIRERSSTHPKRRGLAVLFYAIYEHVNPVFAGLVKNPEDWPYSSHVYYAHGKIRFWWEHFLTPLPEYLALGDTPEERQQAFRELTEVYMDLMTDPEFREGMEAKHGVIGGEDFIIAYFKRLEETQKLAEVNGRDWFLEPARLKRIELAFAEVRNRRKEPEAAGAGEDAPVEQAEEPAVPAHNWWRMTLEQLVEFVLPLDYDWRKYRRRTIKEFPERVYIPTEKLAKWFDTAPEGWTIEYIETMDAKTAPLWLQGKGEPGSPPADLDRCIDEEHCSKTPDCRCHVCADYRGEENPPRTVDQDSGEQRKLTEEEKTERRVQIADRMRKRLEKYAGRLKKHGFEVEALVDVTTGYQNDKRYIRITPDEDSTDDAEDSAEASQDTS